MVPDHVTSQPLRSVLLPVDFTGASVDAEAIRAMNESAVFDKPYIKEIGVDRRKQLPERVPRANKWFFWTRPAGFQDLPRGVDVASCRLMTV
jgi:hypothetical protein